MNIIVCVKQVPDTETKIKPNSDGSYIETTSIKWIMNPYDEFAVEEALKIKAANTGSTVTVVRVGAEKDTEALRTGMAMGADDSILVIGPDHLDSYSTAKAISGAIKKAGKSADLILAGKQAIDDDCLQVPQILAQMMGLPSVSVIVGLEQDGNKLTAKREIEGGSVEIYEVETPCVLSTNKGINTPRYASLPGIMKAKKKPMEKYTLEDVGVSEADQRLKYSDFQLPPEKPPGKTFDATEEDKQQSIVSEVVGLLRNEAKVI
jgi:electron transfer flavoprotein beta subunit